MPSWQRTYSTNPNVYNPLELALKRDAIVIALAQNTFRFTKENYIITQSSQKAMPSETKLCWMFC